MTANLHIDSEAKTLAVNCAGLIALTDTPLYRAAARTKMGISAADYHSMRIALEDESCGTYGVLPRRADEMVGVNARGPYVLHNVRIVSVNGWSIAVRGGRWDFPRVCDNETFTRRAIPGQKFVNTDFRGYFPVTVVDLPLALTTAPFASTTSGEIIATPAGAAVTPSYAAPSAEGSRPSVLPYFAPLLPLLYHLIASPNAVAACSHGSNVMGVCR